MSSNALYLRNLRQARRDAGQCPHCAGEPLPGKVYCEAGKLRRTPQDQAARYAREKAQRIARGLCRKCGKVKVRKYTQCNQCRAKRAKVAG